MATSPQTGADADGRAQPTDATEESHGGFSRRAFLASGVAVGVGAGLGPFGGAVSALAEKPSTGLAYPFWISICVTPLVKSSRLR